MAEQYLIMCIDSYNGDACIWWKPNHHGYTMDIDKAGRYSEEEARSIEGIRGTDVAVPESAIGTRIQVTRIVTWEAAQNASALRQRKTIASIRNARAEREWRKEHPEMKCKRREHG